MADGTDNVFFLQLRGNESTFGSTYTSFQQKYSINRTVTCNQRIQDKLNPSSRSRFGDLEYSDGRKTNIYSERGRILANLNEAGIQGSVNINKRNLAGRLIGVYTESHAKECVVIGTNPTGWWSFGLLK